MMAIKQDDSEETARRYRKAAERGDAKAQVILGELYKNGRGVVQDNEEAMKWYRKAAKQGNAAAQVNIGRMYWYGRARSYKTGRRKAIEWYRKAADQGYARGFYELGLAYEGWASETSHDGAKRWRVRHNRTVHLYKQAMTYFRKAAELGDTDAQRKLGSMLSHGVKGYGDFIEGDRAEALKWYHRAVERGDARAAYDLAFLYTSGWIYAPSRDYMQALNWCLIAKALGFDDTDVLHDVQMLRTMDIDQEVSSSEKEEAYGLAREWLADHMPGVKCPE